ncbi:MAG: hypothetical protein J6R01_08145 [Alistipes sp.]|nr:hypothetical protein [Alistipes sp.]
MAVSQRLTVSQVSQDKPGNRTKYRILWASTQTGASYNNYKRIATYTVRTNDDGTSAAYTVEYTLPKNTTQTVLDIELWVNHRNNGTAAVYVSTEMDTGISAGVVRKSASLIPTPIPRQSIITAGSANIGEALPISLTRYSDSYTHDIAYEFGSLSGSVAEGVTSSSVSWTIPTEFFSLLPTSKSGTGSLVCTTYSNGIIIGTSTASFTAYVPESSAPTLAATIKDVDGVVTKLTGNNSILVKYSSDAGVTLIAQAKDGASISSYKTLCADGKILLGASGRINSVRSGEFTCSVTDSRGYVTSRRVSLAMIDYIRITCNMAVQPVNGSTGVATLTLTGNCFDGSFGAVQNELTLEYRFKQGSGEYTEWKTAPVTLPIDNKYNAVINVPNLDYTKVYTFQARASDLLDTTTTPEKRVKTVPVFHWGESDFVFNVPVTIPSFGGDISDVQKSLNIIAPITDTLTTPIEVIQDLYPSLASNAIYLVCIPGGANNPAAFVMVGKNSTKYGFAQVQSYSVNAEYNCKYRLYNGVWEKQ